MSIAPLISSPLSPLPPDRFAGQATFAGGLAIVGIVRDLLPLRLPPGTTVRGAGDTYHPCLLAFGEQQEGTTFFGGVPVPWGVRYHELLVGIPFVRRADDPADYLFVAGMTCDFWPAIWNGNVYYGFHKRFAPMRWDDHAFAVLGGDGRPEFRASFGEADGGRAPMFDLIRTIASQPVLGWRDAGGFVHSGFDWDFSTAWIRPASLGLSLDAPFNELPTGAGLQVLGEAYRVRGMRWRLSWPGPITS